jgi:hypothetical protein
MGRIMKEVILTHYNYLPILHHLTKNLSHETGGKQMRKLSITVFIFIAIISVTFIMTYSSADTGSTSYAEDRALIVYLQARYMFAWILVIWDTYVKTFTEDGILDIIGFKWQGRENIKREIGKCLQTWQRKNLPLRRKKLYLSTGRHNITKHSD